MNDHPPQHRPVLFLTALAVAVLLCALVGCGGGGAPKETPAPAPTPLVLAAPSLAFESMGSGSDGLIRIGGDYFIEKDPNEGTALEPVVASPVVGADTLLSRTLTSLAPAATIETRARANRATATYTSNVDGIIATSTVTPVNSTTIDFTIVLNGTADDSSGGGPYTNFLFATGEATLGTYQGTSSTHFTITYYSGSSGGTNPVLASADFSVFNYFTGTDYLSTFPTTITESDSAGSITYTQSRSTLTWTSASAYSPTWNWTVYWNGDAKTGRKIGTVWSGPVGYSPQNATVAFYCLDDGRLRSEIYINGETGIQFCRYATACTSAGDTPCTLSN